MIGFFGVWSVQREGKAMHMQEVLFRLKREKRPFLCLEIVCAAEIQKSKTPAKCIGGCSAFW